MTTRTQSRTQRQPDARTQDQPEPQQLPQPAIWLQVVLPSGASQPVGIALDDPAWEQRLDNAVTQVKLFVMRHLLSRKTG